MPQLFPTSREEVDKQIRDLMEALDSDLFSDYDVPGTPAYNAREIWTRMKLRENQELNAASEAFSPRTATGSDLDGWAEFFGMSRKGAAPADGTALLRSEVTGEAAERLQGTNTLPEGTTLTGAQIQLQTTAPARLPDTENTVEVPVESVRPSEDVVATTGTQLTISGNEPLSQIATVELISDVSGGRQAETDEQLRFRLIRALRDPSTPEGLRALLLSDPDVSDVEIREGDQAYGPGTVEAFVTPSVAFPPDGLRERLEEKAEGPTRVYVTFPAYEGVAMKIRTSGPDTNGAERVVDYVNNLSTGDSIIMNDVVDRVQEAGARDAQVIRVKRGSVGPDKDLLDPTVIQSVTNLTPRSDRYRFYTKRSWITLCD